MKLRHKVNHETGLKTKQDCLAMIMNEESVTHAKKQQKYNST